MGIATIRRVFFRPILSTVIPDKIGPKIAPSDIKDAIRDSSEEVAGGSNGLLSGSTLPLRRGSKGEPKP